MKRFLLVAFVTTITIYAFAQQAKLPIIMVVPDNDWCVKYHYVDEVGNPDYLRALQDDNMKGLIMVMGDIMRERKYPLKDMRTALDKIKKEDAMDMVLQSKGHGDVVESDLNRVVREVQADILIELDYDLKNYGGVRHSVEFKVKSVDAATTKTISGDVGRSSVSSAPLVDLLNESVDGFMDNFCYKLNLYFNDLNANGREGTVIFKIAEDCPYNFDSDLFFNGETGELSEIIEYWMNEKTINGAYNLTNSSDVRLVFEQVRFPMASESKFGGKPKALDAAKFMQPISDFLSQFNISCKFQPDGIGQVYIVLGSK